jgi:hypothetical protein
MTRPYGLFCQTRDGFSSAGQWHGLCNTGKDKMAQRQKFSKPFSHKSFREFGTFV